MWFFKKHICHIFQFLSSPFHCIVVSNIFCFIFLLFIIVSLVGGGVGAGRGGPGAEGGCLGGREGGGTGGHWRGRDCWLEQLDTQLFLGSKINTYKLQKVSHKKCSLAFL